MTSKIDALVGTITGNSHSRTFARAVREWELEELPPVLDQYVSCEACGTAIRKTARVKNRLTGSILVIGLTCYDHLLEVIRRGRLSTSLIERSKFRPAPPVGFEGRLSKHYLDYASGVDLHSWKVWFLDAVALDATRPALVARGARELSKSGDIGDSEVLMACLRYHDANRVYPADVLLPRYWRRAFPDAASLLTIDQARELAQRHREERTPPKPLDPGPVVETQIMPYLLRLLKACNPEYMDIAHARAVAWYLEHTQSARRFMSSLAYRERCLQALGTVRVGDVLWCDDGRLRSVRKVLDGDPWSGCSQCGSIVGKATIEVIRHSACVDISDWHRRGAQSSKRRERPPEGNRGRGRGGS